MAETKQTTTDESIEIARAAACVMVILIHASTPFILGGLNYSGFFLANIIDSFCRPAVPIFLMVSGFLVLDRAPVGVIQSYRQTLQRIIIPLSTWTVIYIIFDWLRNGFNYKVSVGKIISGTTYYHFWYMYMLIGLSILSPVILRGWLSFDKIERVLLTLALMIIALLSSIYYQFFPYSLWLFISFVPYTGYYLFGSVSKSISYNISPSNIFPIYIFSALAGAIATIYSLKFWNNLYFYDYFSITTMISSVSLFVWLTRGPFNKSSKYVKFISTNSFFIYMAHPIFLAALVRIMFSTNASAWLIPLFASISMIGSLLMGEIISRTPIRKLFGYR